MPGTVAGLALVHERHGRLPWQQLVEPAAQLAKQGFPVDAELAQSLRETRERMAPWPASMNIFFKADGATYQPGETLAQPDLAASLKLIAEQGAKAFYEGDIAQKLVADMKAHQGLITLDDLKNYRALVRAPVRGSYRGLRNCIHAATLFRRRAYPADPQHPGVLAVAAPWATTVPPIYTSWPRA